MSDRPTTPPGDGSAPAPLTLAELRTLFPAWTIQQVAASAYTATRVTGAATRVVGADTPAEMAAALLRIERQENQ